MSSSFFCMLHHVIVRNVASAVLAHFSRILVHNNAFCKHVTKGFIVEENRFYFFSLQGWCFVFLNGFDFGIENIDKEIIKYCKCMDLLLGTETNRL